jgi:predicted KAP-like P-loop ATPase
MLWFDGKTLSYEEIIVVNYLLYITEQSISYEKKSKKHMSPSHFTRKIHTTANRIIQTKDDTLKNKFKNVFK